MMTTAQDIEGGSNFQSLPRIGTASGTRSRGGLGSAQLQSSSAGQFPRGMSAQNPGQNLPVIRQAENLDENRVVLYKRSKQLGTGYYLVEISTNNTHLFIAAFDVESPESLLIELPEKKA